MRGFLFKNRWSRLPTVRRWLHLRQPLLSIYSKTTTVPRVGFQQSDLQTLPALCEEDCYTPENSDTQHHKKARKTHTRPCWTWLRLTLKLTIDFWPKQNHISQCTLSTVLFTRLISLFLVITANTFKHAWGFSLTVHI